MKRLWLVLCLLMFASPGWAAEPVWQAVLEPIGIVPEVAWSPDGSLIAVNAGGGLQLYDARTGQEVAELLARYRPPPLLHSLADSEKDRIEGWRHLRAPAFTPDGQWLVAVDTTGTPADGKGELRIFNVAGRIETACIDLGWGAGTPTISPSGDRVAVPELEKYVQVFALPSGRQIDKVLVYRYPPGGDIGSSGGAATVLYTPRGEMVPDGGITFVEGGTQLLYAWGRLTLLDIGPRKKAGSSWPWANDYFVYDMPIDALGVRWSEHFVDVDSNCLSVSSDGRWIALGGDTALTLVDRRTGAVVAHMPCPDAINQMLWSPDGRFILAANDTRLSLYAIPSLTWDRP